MLDEPVSRLADVERDDLRDDAPSGEEEDEGERDDVAIADMVLAGMAARPADVELPQAVETPQRRDQTLSELVSEVADRILVGASGPDGAKEVRILLKDDVLGGSEVRISEHAGAVRVTFVAGTKDAQAFLDNHRQDIASSLGERLDREVEVTVTGRDGTTGDNSREGDGDQQPEAGGDNDGRSHNRRDIRDEQERPR